MLALVFIISFIVLAHCKSGSSELKHVGYYSIIKLTHNPTGYKLHSHKVSYSTGSQQQSVTAFPFSGDPNSLWQVQPELKHSAIRGDTIPCGATIRLYHINTDKYLHSHLHNAPLSSNQEVSAFENRNKGDHWKINCKDSNDKHWKRGQLVTLTHEETSKHLSSFHEFSFQGNVGGQLEVSAENRINDNTYWKADEGIYFKLEKN